MLPGFRNDHPIRPLSGWLALCALWCTLLLTACGTGGLTTVPGEGGAGSASSGGSTIETLSLSESSTQPHLLTAPGITSSGLSGLVQSSSGSPLAKATVLLDTGASVVTPSTGRFTFTGVAPGKHQVSIACTGYKPAVGSVTLYGNQTTSVLVSLTPTTPVQTTGTLGIGAYRYSTGGQSLPVYRIEVSEYGNYAKRWSNTWYSDLGNVRVDLSCTGANLGKVHTIKVTWRGSTGVEQSGTWQRTFTTSGQTETFYGPY